MSKKIYSNIQIGVALIAAILMLLISSFIEDSHTSETVIFWIMTIWFIPFSYLNSKMETNCKNKIQVEK